MLNWSTFTSYLSDSSDTPQWDTPAGSVDTFLLVEVTCPPVNQTGKNPRQPAFSRTVAIIPARYRSTRFPGKVLSEIAGKPMVLWVAERAVAAKTVERVIIATDDERVADLVVANGYEARITRAEHPTGTDRVSEVARELANVDIVVNVQGDEPLISPDTIDAAVNALKLNQEAGIATTWEPIADVSEVLSPDVVKIVVSDDGHAIYFSRSPVPFPRDAVIKYGSLEAALNEERDLIRQFKKHTGLYVYRREVLLSFTTWRQSKLEELERLEQLRALENDVTIVATQAATASIGVDTVADLRRVEALAQQLESLQPGTL